MDEEFFAEIYHMREMATDYANRVDTIEEIINYSNTGVNTIAEKLKDLEQKFQDLTRAVCGILDDHGIEITEEELENILGM